MNKGKLFGALALTTVSRLVSAEYLHQAYTNHSFHFPLKHLVTSDWKRYNISESVLSKIRHIRFVRDYANESMEAAIFSERGIHFHNFTDREICPNLRTVEVGLVLTERMLEEREVKECGKWDWGSTAKGCIGVENVWAVPRSEWRGGLWVL